LVVKAINSTKKPAPDAPATTKDCPACTLMIPINATRCPHCTTELSAG
jgi:large conductance mechanosensitive channel